MGHTRLGTIPKTRKWRAVVELLSTQRSSSASLVNDVPTVAKASLQAAQTGLGKARNDVALKRAFYLLTQIVLSARENDWETSLQNIGITLPENPTAFDLTVEAQAILDAYVRQHDARTDIAELAQQAFGEALTETLTPRTASLFGVHEDELRTTLRGLSTKVGFSKLAQSFFSRFVYRFLNFYLSRITASKLGTANVSQLGDISEFNRALQLHCDQSAEIVREFSGSWYSKTEFEEGIDQANSARFIAVALKKLRAELEKQMVAE